jgi:tryptophan synthase alpha chain
VDLVPALVDAGCDAIELGIPFSDPLADGATIQRASFTALQQGTTTTTCLEIAAAVSPVITAPVLFMGYYNPILRYGLEAFCNACAKAGVAGLIVPDLPPEESAGLHTATISATMSLVYLVAPSTPDQRMRLIVQQASGFLYLVSLAGVTGARDSLPANVETFVQRVKQATALPLAVGFGISTPEQAARVSRVADGVIVGSALLSVIDVAVNAGADPVTAAVDFVCNLRSAIDSV